MKPRNSEASTIVPANSTVATATSDTVTKPAQEDLIVTTRLMDVDKEDLLDYGSPTATNVEPGALAKGDDLVTFTDGERGGDESGNNESTNPGLVNFAEFTTEKIHRLKLELAIANTRHSDVKADLAAEREITCKQFVEIDRKNYEIEQLEVIRVKIMDKAQWWEAEAKEVRGHLDDAKADIADLRQELTQLRPPQEVTRSSAVPEQDVNMDRPNEERFGTFVLGAMREQQLRERAAADARLPKPTGYARRTVKDFRLVAPPAGWEVHEYDEEGMPDSIATWQRMFDIQSIQRVWPYGYLLFKHYLFSKGVPKAERSVIHSWAIKHYKMPDWVSDIMRAVGAEMDATQKADEIARYKDCSIPAITVYNPTAFGKVIQYRQKDVMAVPYLDDGSRGLESTDRRVLCQSVDEHIIDMMLCPSWFAAVLTDLNIMVAPNLNISQWQFGEVPAPVTEEEFVHHVAAMGINTAMINNVYEYAHEWLSLAMQSEHLLKGTGWTSEKAAKIYEPSQEVDPPVYKVPVEHDILLHAPSLPYPAKADTWPVYCMFEWNHPDLKDIPRQEELKIQAAINKHRGQPMCAHYANNPRDNRVSIINPFTIGARKKNQRKESAEAKWCEYIYHIHHLTSPHCHIPHRITTNRVRRITNSGGLRRFADYPEHAHTDFTASAWGIISYSIRGLWSVIVHASTV
ncbi:hypothetical protein DFH07DRAFT_973782 [Mycena maculata]|uniref:Uncharacterized protein n=1 Tax=Mycena maculata TaxID=230809 RepID=A0AAD7MH88_9AGAR|nr:hypothetical protein DFH07DRAFT_973782 [Mycena maculata]